MEDGRKFDNGKLRFDLIPPEIEEELARVLTYGAAKYEDNNWQKVETQRYIAALRRHINSWRMGEVRDQESGLRHLSHALCNLSFILWKEINGE